MKCSAKFTLLILLCLLQACAAQRPPVPVGTIPPARPITPAEEQHGHQVLSALTKEFELDYSHPRYQEVLDVVEKLTTAIKANTEPWHIYVLKGDEVKNAAATRGNHIFIWTGMINATQDDDELAAVLGHEIGHVLARHTDADPNETLRKALVEVAAIAAGIAVAVATENPSLGQNAGRLTSSASRELGNAIAVYPYSRKRELEADHIGLFLMHKAGYNPEAAVRFWERALNDPGFGSSVAFLSTHPPAEQRLDALREFLPLVQQQGGYASNANPKSKSKPLSSSHSTRSTKHDSFDVSNTLQTSEEFQSWRVVTGHAVVYQRPSQDSKALGEFRTGAIVLGARESAAWVRIQSPDPGFIAMSDLEKTAR